MNRSIGGVPAGSKSVQSEARDLQQSLSGAFPPCKTSSCPILAWTTPAGAIRGAVGRDLLFPASTLARKGAGEVAAARELVLRVQLGGPILEGDGCWRGVETLPARAGWAGVGVVVLPAWVEHQPRRLLQALAAGVPVVASEACGLEGMPGVTNVPAGDVPALTAAVERCLRAENSLRTSISVEAAVR